MAGQRLDLRRSVKPGKRRCIGSATATIGGSGRSPGSCRSTWPSPPSHVSFYEADAFARWRSHTFAAAGGVRLPSEQQWEHAARKADHNGSPDAFLDGGRLRASAAPHLPHAACDGPLQQMFGVLWQWTSSHYEPYPGYRPFAGNLAEYNGKFMDNQRVLRGGSCVTPRDHFRVSYRNFWPAPTRFQFTGIRLARDL